MVDYNTDVSLCIDPIFIAKNQAPREEFPLRLVNGGALPMQGQVEVRITGIWETICSYIFDEKDAAVVCSVLGFS